MRPKGGLWKVFAAQEASCDWVYQDMIDVLREGTETAFAMAISEGVSLQVSAKPKALGEKMVVGGAFETIDVEAARGCS